ncbi:AEBP1 protein, partial [Climacteris rufus]|nr:AEBP1 protein [Climacteris rufus]
KNKPPKKSKEKPPKGSKKPPEGSEKTQKGSKKPKEKPPKATKPSVKKPPVPPSPPPESPTTLPPPWGKDDEETPEFLEPLHYKEEEDGGVRGEFWVPEDPEPPTLDYNEQLEREDYEDFEYIRQQQKPPRTPSRRRPERVWPRPEETTEPEEAPPQPLPQPPLPGPVTEGDYGEGFEPTDYDDWTYGLPPPLNTHKHPDKEDRMETDEEKIRL